MKVILIGSGFYAKVDDVDFPKLSALPWFSQRATNGVVYAALKLPKKPKTYMHRIISGAKKGEWVDHRDRNGLNNQKSNLRICSASQNIAGKRMSRNNTSGFKGVGFCKKSGRWHAYIKKNRKFIFLGSFTNPLAAAKSYDAAAIRLNGQFARTNKQLGLL